MLKLKSQLTCSYCSRIFKDPIELPCEDNICRQHLSERDVVKENRIKCKKCNEDFQVKGNDFKSIQAFTKLIESQSYLNEEEKSLKQDLEASIRKFFEFYDEYEQNKTKLQSKAFDHFQEMRFQIDEHRERLKERIDDIALAMIDHTKKHEEIYLSELINLCEFTPNDKWTLLYRGTRDGFGSDVFHSRCDGHTNTLTILKAKQSSYIFGGFTTVSWDGSSLWKSDRNAFIFSLTNKDNKPLKIKIDSNEHQHAICCYSKFGPIFGIEIVIANNTNTTMDSYSNLGWAYLHPLYTYRSNEAETFLSGSHKLQLD
jgi:hypothetical protein